MVLRCPLSGSSFLNCLDHVVVFMDAVRLAPHGGLRRVKTWQKH